MSIYEAQVSYKFMKDLDKVKRKKNRGYEQSEPTESKDNHE